MKPTAGGFVMLGVIAITAVSFYLEIAVWDAHGWSRNNLVLLSFSVLALPTWVGGRGAGENTEIQTEILSHQPSTCYIVTFMVLIPWM